MLRQLAIHNIVLVERLELEFEPGLGVLTGETGAGKSILLDALGLALGARADAGLVRAGQESASVSAEIELPADHPAECLLDEQGLSVERGEPLIVRRTLKSDGGSRAFIGGASVPAGLLRDVGAVAVEIHGHHDDRGLLNPKGHRALLDAFGKLDKVGVEQAWAEVTRTEAELLEARAAAAAAERDREWLEHASAEVEALAPEAGEETRLAEERATMQAGLKAGESLTGLDELLGGSEGALAQLRQVARRIERGAADHPLLAEALAALDRALIEASEAEDRIARAAEAMAFDPARLDQVEARLFDIRGVARKHRVEADALAALGGQMRAQLAAIEAGGERIAEHDRQLLVALESYAAAADAHSRKRREAAARLDAAVASELAPLKLDSAKFRTAIAPVEPGPSGTDRVEFEVSTNPGAPFGPLTRIASGGELSRFILALKVALAEAGSAATMIFDEVDRGVGGAVASAI
ncbi:MAG: DNA repair protein RecN, partial [Sphingomicrobium sp.]